MYVQEKCPICKGDKKSKKAVTCSRECGEKLKRASNYETRSCKTCGSLFEERIKKERSFCSDLCRKNWQMMPENIAKRIKKAKQATKEKYGVESAFLLKSVQEKAADSMRKTLMKKGDERSKKIKKTKLERYGSESYNNVEGSMITKKKKYGDKNYNNRDKAKNTTIERYGVDHAMKSDEVRKIASDSLMKSHGVTSPLKSEEVKEKMKKTLKDKYGVDNYSMTDEFKEKVGRTWLSRIETTKQFQLIKQLESNGIEMLNEFIGFQKGGSYVDYTFKCKDCGNVFNRKFCNPTIPICRKCHPSPTSPRTHTAIRDMLKENGISFTENTRRAIDKMELDFFLHERNLAIELDGNYFHSERAGETDDSYHLSKTKMSNEKGIRLIHIFEDEILLKTDIVLSRLMSMLGISNRSIGARECNLIECSFEQKREFFSDNHIQGDTPSKIAFGLLHDGNMVAAMSFGSPRKALGNNGSRNGNYELLRFCMKNGYNVKGAFSKLFSHFIKHYSPEKVTTFADIRWSGYDPSRTVYAKNGFKFESHSRPNYWYFKRGDYMTRHHRFQFRKDVLVKKSVEVGMVKNEEEAKLFTEWELAQLMGMDRIWDCGNMKFSWTSL